MTETQLQGPPNAFDPSIDDTTKNYRIRVDNELYTNFIEPSNYKTSIVVSATGSSFTTNSVSTALADGETHNMTLGINSIYSDRLEHGYNELKLTFSGIQWSADPLMEFSGLAGPQGYIGDPAAFKMPTAVANKTVVDNLLGIPCPWIEGLSGLACDALNSGMNSSITVDWGNTTQPSTTTFYEPVSQAELLLYDRKLLEETDRLLLPDVVGDNEFLRRIGLFKKYLRATGGYSPFEAVRPSDCLVEDIVRSKHNTFSLENRHRVPKTIVFKKGIASPNYTYNEGAGTWTATGDLETLHTIVYGGISLPSYVSQTDFDKSGISVWDAIFYFDKKNKLGSGTDEPAGQSLTQEVMFKNISSALRLREFKTFNPRSFHNVTNLVIRKTYTGNKGRIFKTLIPRVNDLNGVVLKNGTVSAVNYPSMVNVKIDVSVSAPFVRMKVYKMSAGLKLSKTSVIAYTEKNIKPVQASFILGGLTWRALTYPNGVCSPITHSLNTLPLSVIPKAKMFIVSLHGNDNLDNSVSPLSMATIHKITFKLDNDRPLLQTFNEADLLRISRKNGLNISFDDIVGKLVSSPDVRITEHTGKKVILHDVKTMESCKRSLKSIKNGFPVLLCYGSDVVLSEALAPGVSGLNMIEDIELTMSADSNSTVATIYVVDIFDEMIFIDSEGNAKVNPKELALNSLDAVNAMKSWNNKVASGSLYVNVSSVNGGSWFSSAVNRVSSMLPKVLPMIKKGLDYYDKNRDAIHGVVNSASQGNASGTVKSLQELLRAK